MNEKHDRRISELYRQSSQETPPAYLDRTMLEMASRSVHRRAFTPFGGHWLAGGALAGVVVLGVLLLLEMPGPPVRYATVPHAEAPARATGTGMPGERMETGGSLSGMPAAKEERRVAPAVPASDFKFYESLQDRVEPVPEDAARMHSLQRQAAEPEEKAVAESASPATGYYLQAGSFRDKAHADVLRARLARLGFRCDIQTVSIEASGVYHRVRIGPFADLDKLEQSRRKLTALGFETQPVTPR